MHGGVQRKRSRTQKERQRRGRGLSPSLFHPQFIQFRDQTEVAVTTATQKISPIIFKHIITFTVHIVAHVEILVLITIHITYTFYFIFCLFQQQLRE